jgi:hypothetical protein
LRAGAVTLAGTRERGGVCAFSAPTAVHDPPEAGAATGVLDGLREHLSSQAFSMCFGVAEERPGSVLALPNEFVRGVVSRRFGDELRRWAESTGVVGVELVVDPALRHPPGPAIDAAEDHDLDTFLRAGPSPSAAPFPLGLTTRLLAERGFWSLAPGVRADGFAVDDLRGTLSVEPGRLGGVPPLRWTPTD